MKPKNNKNDRTKISDEEKKRILDELKEKMKETIFEYRDQESSID